MSECPESSMTRNPLVEAGVLVPHRRQVRHPLRLQQCRQRLCWLLAPATDPLVLRIGETVELLGCYDQIGDLSHRPGLR